MVAEGSPATGFEPICCGPFQPDTYQLCFTLALVAFQNTSMMPLACAAAGEACRELHAVRAPRASSVTKEYPRACRDWITGVGPQWNGHGR